MNDLLASAIVLVAGIAGLGLMIRRYSRVEQRYMTFGFVAHILGAFAQIWITLGVYDGGGDMFTYMTEGSMVARAMEYQPEHFVPLWLDLLLQRDPEVALPIVGAGHATGSMVALTAALAIVFRYSIYAACLAVAIMAFFGKLALYRVFREELPREVHIRALVGILLVPSAVMWSSGLLKESFVAIGLGPLWLGVHRVLKGRLTRGLLLIVFGFIPIALCKPYTLFALTVSIGGWVAVDRLKARSSTGEVKLRPVYLVIGAGLVYAGVIALGRIYPVYSIENLGEDFARHQRLGGMAGGGSYYQIGDEGAMSLQKQIVFAPIALATTLFRPFIFEARNGLAFFASLEATAFTFLIGRAVLRTGPRDIFRTVLAKPVLFAGLLFVLTFGMAVGLATTNFGSLSRFRTPLIPFYAVFVLAIDAQAQRRHHRLSPLRTQGIRHNRPQPHPSAHGPK